MFSRLSPFTRSLHAQAILRIVLPLSLILAGLVMGGAYVYYHTVTSLIIERHHRLASLAAASVSDVIMGYANVLEALASKNGLQSLFPEERVEALREVEGVLEIFDAGVIIVDKQGVVITSSGDNSISFLSDVSASETFQSVRAHLVPSFSNVLYGENAHDALVLIAVPLFDAQDRFAGAVIGAMDLHSSPVRDIVKKLTIGKDGFSYLFDRDGIILAHPDPQQIGADYSHLSYDKKVAAGESGRTRTEPSTGERLVEGYAPIEIAGWGLVIQESWDSATEPEGLFGILVIAVGLAVIILVVFLSWKGFERVAVPIQALHEQTVKLARGEKIEPMMESGIDQIDALEGAFLRMEAQISAYRAGLRRYVGAITKSQEDERRRIARELHDDTIQSLLAISRRLELYQSSASDPERQEQIATLQDMVTTTLVGIRQINRDLRPLMLEDLGLIPALQTLVRAAQRGEGAIPHAKFETTGSQIPLDPEQELALYRITQEALVNIRKHAHATGGSVALSFGSGVVILEISDDGKGFEVPPALTDFAQHDCFGLLGIQERVWAVGGSLSIHSSPGQGTKLSVTVPVMSPNPGN